MKLFRHRQQWRYANASRQQQRRACMVNQGEVVPRLADPERVTLSEVVMHAAGAASRSPITEDTQHVAVPLDRIVAQRVLTDGPPRHVDVNVRTCRELRQRPFCRICKLEQTRIQGINCLARHYHLDLLHSVSLLQIETTLFPNASL